MTSLASRVRAALAVVLLGLSVSACGYNNIPTLEEQAKAKWADVQNNYQRRADLIPNLVATVQGYAKQEKDVLTAVVEARAKATQVRIDASQLTDPDKLKQFQDAQNQLSGALGRLLAVSENYPDLKPGTTLLEEVITNTTYALTPTYTLVMVDGSGDRGTVHHQPRRNLRTCLFEADRRSWDDKLVRLQKDLESEPQKVRNNYAVAARQLEPIGLVYLWPTTS